MTGRYRKYLEYKSSDVDWIGNIPSHWSIIKGLYLGRLFGSESIGEELVKETGDIPFIKVSSLSLEGFELSGLQFFVDKKSITLSKSKKNYIVFPKRGAAIFTNKVNIVKYASFIDPNLMGWKINNKAIPEIVAYLLKLRGLGDIADVSTVPQINNKHIEPIKFPIAPYKEQQKIANFLDHETAKIDTLIAKQEKLIELLKEKRQTVISHAVTKGLNPDTPMKDSGVEWLGEVPEHWLIGRYKDCTKRIVVGIAEAATHAYADVGVPLIRSTNIKDDGLLAGSLLFLKENFAESNSSKYLFHNDIVTVRTGYPGISAVIPKHLDRSHCFTNLVSTPNEQHKSEFLAEFLNSHLGKAYFKLQGWGSAQQNISVPILESTPIAFPSLSEQIEIYIYIGHQRSKFKKLISFSERSIELMQERKTALISAAVTGKIDVRDWEIS